MAKENGNDVTRLNSSSDKEEELSSWKRENNYHRRSLIETNMSRMNFIFWDQMSAPAPENQFTDLAIRCRIINKMNKLGLPKSVLVF